MQTYFSLAQFDETAGAIRSKTKEQPKIGIILGSGLGSLADSIDNPVIIPFKDLPHWPRSTVPGHVGRLIIGKLEGQDILVMQGRIHFYEGYSMQQVTLPIRVMQRLGINTLIVTNAAGAVNPEFMPGDLMLITDHINFVGLAGFNPLFGPNIDELGPRFPDMSQAYDRELIKLAKDAAVASSVELREGIYIGLSGPSFEGPADLRFLRLIGADAVGMSTVSEVTVARHGNTRVLGLSGISNKANLDGSSITTHEEVLEAGRIIAPKMERLIRSLLRRL
jgi:purine-nucleoside phosphorylase